VGKVPRIRVKVAPWACLSRNGVSGLVLGKTFAATERILCAIGSREHC